MKKMGMTLVGMLMMVSCSHLVKKDSPARGLASACVDEDGDGWGWDGSRSCKMPDPCVDSDGDGWGWDGSKSCKMPAQACVDTDGDGWGWDGTKSCKMPKPCIDPDGDGWGWDGSKSCKMPAQACVDTEGDGWGWDGSQTCIPKQEPGGPKPPVNCEGLAGATEPYVDHVTDVVLTAGQSNATGGKTAYDPSLATDRVNPRVIVWTDEGRWETADPSKQTWNEHRFPTKKGSTVVYNHPAFQIGRAIADRAPCRVVAIIATSAFGKPIAYWLENRNNHFSEIDSKVSAALYHLPKKSVDMIWWMQGESDNIPDHDFFLSQIHQLRQRFNTRQWFDSGKYFLANETGWSLDANKAIRLLATDTDPTTDFSRGEDKPEDPFPFVTGEERNPTHFNAEALRKIGNRVANKYLYEYLSP